MKKLMLAVTLFSMLLNAQFNRTSTIMDNESPTVALFADFDNDDDLDLFISSTTPTGPETKIIRNDGGVYNENIAVLSYNLAYTAEAGDYENDGDIDILVNFGGGANGIKIFINDSGSFMLHETGLSSSNLMNWGDLDNDGDMDIYLNFRIYENIEGVYSFKQMLEDIPYYWWLGEDYDRSTLFDFNGDGDLDIIMFGDHMWSTEDALPNYTSNIVTHSNNRDLDSIKLDGCWNIGYPTYGDMDNDGISEIMSTRTYFMDYQMEPEFNDSIAYAYLMGSDADESGILPFKDGAWGDLDNDGDLDFTATGFTDQYYGTHSTSAHAYRNDQSAFSTIQELRSIVNGECFLGDIDNDSDLDIFLYDDSLSVFENSCSVYNNSPDPPNNLSASQSGYNVVLGWDPASDNETPSEGLSYNIYVRSETGNCDIVSPMSNISNGYRKVVKTGNAGQRLTYTLEDLVPGTYYWSVQSIDHCYAGSEYAAEQSFVITEIAVPDIPTAFEPTEITNERFTANWSASANATGYILDVSADSLFSNFITGYENYDAGDTLSETITGLTAGTDHYYRICAYNSVHTSRYSDTIQVITEQIPPPPDSLWTTNITTAGFKANWSITPGAEGYQIDVANDSLFNSYLIGFENLDMGNMTSKIISGLETDSTYFFRIRSYVSGFISENSDSIKVSIPIVVPPIALEASGITSTSFVANWEISSGATGYFIDVAIDSLFSNYLSGYENLNVGSVNTKTITGLEMQKDYYYRVRATDDTNISPNSSIVHVRTIWELFSVTGAFPWSISSYSNSAWGDYDNDGDLDLVKGSKLYRNDGSWIFTQVDIGLPGDGHYLKCGDYDNDGDLDILCLQGIGSYYTNYLKIMENNGDGSFTGIDLGIRSDEGCFGDFDKDGDLDILNTYNGVVYFNDSGSFTDYIDVTDGSSYDWMDYDNDGDLDILAYEGFIKNNNDGTFTYKVMFEGSLDSYGDFNNDGYPDMTSSWRKYYSELFPEEWDCDYYTKVYRYNPGTDTYSSVISRNYDAKASVWGDYDNNGDLDLIISGSYWEVDDPYITPPWYGSMKAKTEMFSNFSGTLSFDEQLNNNGYYTMDLVDADNDGDLDLLASYTYSAVFYMNNIEKANTPPGVPSNLASSVDEYQILLSWDPATDNETDQNGLSYNVCIGSTPGGCDILSPESDLNTGYRRVLKTGNAGVKLQFEINYLTSGTYYWSVQAVDHGFTGSQFAAEQMFMIAIPVPEAPVALIATDVGADRFKTNWSSVEYATGYLLDVSTDSLFITYLPGFERKDVTNVNSFELTGLTEGVRYYYRIKAYNLDGIESGYSNTISLKTQIINIIASNSGSIAWGDYNNDGYPDIFKGGSDPEIFMNKGDKSFEKIDAGLIGTGSISLCDFNNDGFVDMFCGDKLYQNDKNGNFNYMGNVFASANAQSWGDYDNDGDQDLLCVVSGKPKILRNDQGLLTEYDAGFPQFSVFTGKWFDYDNDGDLDVIISGEEYIDSFNEQCLIYTNNGDGTFVELSVSLTGLAGGSVDCGDYDNDGYCDILITGYKVMYVMDANDNFDFYRFSYTQLYKNNGNNTFTSVENEILDIYGNGIFTDYNNDGLIDIIVSGLNSYYQDERPVRYTQQTKVYVNNGNGTFSEVSTPHLDGFLGNIAITDYNNDMKPDMLFSGNDGESNITKIFDCGASSTNASPSAPSNLSAIQAYDNSLTFSWDKATDAETPQNGLSYNLYIGSQADSCDIVSPMSEITTGYRRIVGLGNAQQNTSWTIKDIAPGTYYWSVQAIDHSFAGSPFAPEQTITVTGIEDELIPLVTELYQNYPNPFNPATEIRFSLAEDAKVNLSVYNTNGQLVRTLIDGKTEKGYHTVSFDASELNSGMYLYMLDVNGKVQTKKMLMLK